MSALLKTRPVSNVGPSVLPGMGTNSWQIMLSLTSDSQVSENDYDTGKKPYSRASGGCTVSVWNLRSPVNIPASPPGP